MAKTITWLIIKTLQALGLITVVSGLYWGIKNHDMFYEIQMVLYGTALFYGSTWIERHWLQT